MISPLLASIDTVHDGFPRRQKDIDKARLFREICRRRWPTRKALAERLALRPASVSQAVQELIADGFVGGRRRTARRETGRPLEILVPRPDRLTAISIYVDSRELKGVLLALDESILAEEVRQLPAEAPNHLLSSAIVGLARSLCSHVPGSSSLAGCCVSLVGTVNPATCMWMNAARWPRLSNLDLSGAHARLGFPLRLQKTNETELAYWLAAHPANAAGSVLHLHWGFGIGSAVCHRGVMLASSIGRFGEIGHARLAADGSARCTCGSRGCLETEAALWALLPRLAERFGMLPEDENTVAPLLGDPRVLDVTAVRKAVVGVQAALLLLHRIFYPDTILLSGPFVENRAVAARLIEGLERSLPAYARGTVSIVVIPAGMNGCRLGGASSLFRDTLRQILRRKG